MVLLCEQDRDALRFLRVDNAEKVSSPMHFTRVVFGISASPFFLIATVTHHFPKYQKSPALVYTILRSIMNHDSGFIIGIAYDFFFAIERTPKTYLEKQPST